MTRTRSVPFSLIALGMLALLITVGIAGLFAAGAGAAPAPLDPNGRAAAAAAFTPIATPVPATDPAGGRVIDRAEWQKRALPACLFTIFIWAVVAAVVIGIVATGRLRSPVVPGLSDIEAAGRR